MDLFGAPPPAEEPEIMEVETPPPPADDAPQTARNATTCHGHTDVERHLLELHATGRMPHAMIFSGPAGIGKSVMAYRLARFLLKNKPADPNQDSMFGDLSAETPNTLDVPDTDPVFRRVASGGHPDLLGIGRKFDESKGRQELSISIEEVRRIAPFLRRTAAEGGWRVVIIDDAETMTTSSQNGLLKILEEPPANTVLILVAHRAGALIPTIRSRARVINFRPLPQHAIETILQKHGFAFAPEEMDTLMHISGGSAGKALGFIADGGLDLLAQILAVFEKHPDYDWLQIHALAEDLGRYGRDQAYAGFAALMPWIASQLAIAKARGEGSPRQPLQIKAFTTLMHNSSLARMGEICENLQSHFETVQRSNLDKRQGVLQAFSIMQKAA